MVGSLERETRTNLYSTPTLDLQVDSDAEPFGLRDQFTKVFKLTTSSIRVRDPDCLLSELYPCLRVEDNAAIEDYKVRLIFGVKC